MTTAVGRVPCRVAPCPAPPPLSWGSSGFFTEAGCVTAAWPREPSGVLKHARCWCRPRSGCLRVPAASSAWAVERLSREKRGARRKARAPGAARGSHPRPGGSRGVLRAAGGASPTPPLPPLHWLSVPHPRLLRSEPPRQGASVARSRARLGGSPSPLARPVLPRARRERVVGVRQPLPSPPIALRSATRPASGAGQPRPADARAEPSPSRGETGDERMNDTRAKLRSGPGSLPAAAREGPAAGVGGALPFWGRARPALPQAPGSRRPLPPPVPSLPCRHRRVRDAAPAGRSGPRAGAVRVGRARRRAGRASARVRAPRVAATWLILPVAYACLKA